MESFNLYREAKNQYEKLIPERNDGLILLSLYAKYKDRALYKEHGTNSSRIENYRNNIIFRFTRIVSVG